MSTFATTRTRVMLGAAGALSLGLLGACKSGDILKVKDPDVLGVGAYTTPAGVDPLRFGVLGDFAYAYDGEEDNFAVLTGTMADELFATDTFDDRLSVNARRTIPVNGSTEGDYRGLQQAHIEANQAIAVMASVAPTEKSQRAEMYIIRGFTEIFFGEGWCSGTAFSSQVGTTITYGQPNTTSQLFTIAAASFDTALTLADTSLTMKYAAQVGKGRALLDNGSFAAAAAAVVGVPRSFKYLDYHSTSSNREQNGVWNAEANGASRYSLSNNEGTNGLPYLSQPGDPRLPWVPSTRGGFDGATKNLPTETKFGQTSSGIIADGTEAALITLEAELQLGTQAARDSVFAGLNDLRTTNSPPIAPLAGSAPTDQTTAVTQFFTERAYWLWLTGHRLGDMRRLVRQYGRDPNTVYPIGNIPAPLVGTYSNQTSIVLPLNENNNPNVHGCLDQNP